MFGVIVGWLTCSMGNFHFNFWSSGKPFISQQFLQPLRTAPFWLLWLPPSQPYKLHNSGSVIFCYWSQPAEARDLNSRNDRSANATAALFSPETAWATSRIRCPLCDRYLADTHAILMKYPVKSDRIPKWYSGKVSHDCLKAPCDLPQSDCCAHRTTKIPREYLIDTLILRCYWCGTRVAL